MVNSMPFGEGFKELSNLLEQMEELVDKEIEVRQTHRREQVDEILLAQKKLLEEHFSMFPRQRMHEFTSMSSTEFYRSLFCTLSEFLVLDLKELKRKLDCCIA